MTWTGNFIRYVTGAWIGALITMTALMSGQTAASSTTATNAATLFAIINQYKGMVARDDRILNVFMDGNWDRSMCYQRTIGYFLEDGTMVWHLRKVDCE